MTRKQCALTESNLDLVDKVIRRYIHPNDAIPGMSYEDLYQEGGFALCRAAMRYDGRVSFSTFAGTLIRNHLIDVCRSSTARYAHEGPADNLEVLRDKLENIRGPDRMAETDFSAMDAKTLIDHAKAECTPLEKEGIDALWLKMWRFSTAEIGKTLGLTENQVGKRLSKARKILRQDPDLLRAVQ